MSSFDTDRLPSKSKTSPCSVSLSLSRTPILAHLSLRPDESRESVIEFFDDFVVPLNRDTFVKPRFYWIVRENEKRQTGDDSLLLLTRRETFFRQFYR